MPSFALNGRKHSGRRIAVCLAFLSPASLWLAGGCRNRTADDETAATSHDRPDVVAGAVPELVADASQTDAPVSPPHALDDVAEGNARLLSGDLPGAVERLSAAIARRTIGAPFTHAHHSGSSNAIRHILNSRSIAEVSGLL